MSPTIGQTVQTGALWGWSTPAVGYPQMVQSYPTVPGAVTKTGLLRADLESFIGTTIQLFTTPPTGIDDATVNEWIREAEDDIESETNIRLCQTWIAAPPAKTQQEVQLLNLGVQNNYQQLGIDYDLSEPGYDFFFERWRDEGWGYVRTRWRPVKSIEDFNPTGIVSNNYVGTKNVAFIYPLLNEFFRMPSQWVVEDQNRGLLRFVPATSVQMLPLFSLQLAFMGFAQSVPQGLWFQYTAGLTANDYNSDWSFMKQLVLSRAGIIAFQNMQFSVNLGAIELTTQVDGLMQKTRYSEKGAFAAQIQNLQDQSKRLTKRAMQKGGGVFLGVL